MTGIDFEIKGREEIEDLGFRYEPDMTKCQGHMFNNLPMEVDLRHRPDYELQDIEADVDLAFRTVLRDELKEVGIESLHSVSWTRLFQFADGWNPRNFTAIFYVRILAVDANKGTDGHVIRA